MPTASSETASVPTLRPRRFAPSLKALGQTQAAQASVALIALVIVAALTSPTASDGSRIFFEAGNLTDIVRQVSLIGILALGMTFVILTGGIDLSVGSMLALSTSIVAAALTHWSPDMSPSLHILAAMALAVVACGAIGAVNGLIVARLRVQPFIVTLAAMIGVRGLAKWFTGNENIDIGFGDDVAAQFADIFRQKTGRNRQLRFCWPQCSGVLLSKTVFGRHVRAIGDNPTAACTPDFRSRARRSRVYTLSGLLAGIAGVLYAAENHQGNPNAGVSYELDAIAAVVIGGARLSGGQGTISGTDHRHADHGRAHQSAADSTTSTATWK